MSTAAARWRTTLLAGAGFIALQLGWLLSLAPGYGIDEFDHAYKASSVAEGHWKPSSQRPPTGKVRGELIPVRADLVPAVAKACTTRPYTAPYDCKPFRTLADGEVLVGSGASRYNPTFYAVVGTAAKPFHGTANLIAMRVVTALLAGALFMLVVWLAVAGARTVWPLATVLLAALPTTVYSTAIASPNGIEMIAGLGVWVAATSVLDGSLPGRAPGLRTTAYGALGLCAVVMANTHTLGVLWLGLILVVLAALHGPRATVRSLLPRARTEYAVLAATVVGVGFELAWMLLSRVNDPSAVTTTFDDSPWPSVVTGLVLWPLQVIGVFPMRNEAAPLGVYALVLALVVWFVATALRRSGVRTRTGATLAVLVTISFAVPAVLTVLTYHSIGAAWQGRYEYPFAVGALVLLGRVLDGGPGRFGALFALVVALAMPVAHLLSQLHVVRVAASRPDLVVESGWAVPGSALLVLLAVAAAASWCAAIRTSTRTRPPAPVGAPSPQRLHEEVFG